MSKANLNGFKGRITGKLVLLGLGTTHKDLEHVRTCGVLGAYVVQVYTGDYLASSTCHLIDAVETMLMSPTSCILYPSSADFRCII